jgi:hypothetical protein
LRKRGLGGSGSIRLRCASLSMTGGDASVSCATSHELRDIALPRIFRRILCRRMEVAETTHDAPFWDKHPGLVWSNRQAGDGVRIRAALMKPSFPVLLDIAVTFGLHRLEQEWTVLLADSETDTSGVEPLVSTMLANIRRGYEQAGT